MPNKRMHQRMYAHDYTRVGFYMITMTTAGRRPIFGECRDNIVHLSPIGDVVQRRWLDIPSHRPQIEASTMVVMPDHLHGILYVKEDLDKPLGNTLRGFASGVTAEVRTLLSKPDMVVWEKGYHDRVIMSKKTLHAERRYIKDNPRRYCLKKDNADLFVRVNSLRHPRLPSREQWAGYGNLFLLDRPLFVPVQISRRAAPQDIDALKRHVGEQLATGAVAISPFISAGEKAIAKMVMERDHGSLVLVKSAGFPPLYKPSGAYFERCAQGRLLVLTGFPYTGRRASLTRECCLSMNAWVKEICANNSAAQ